MKTVILCNGTSGREGPLAGALLEVQGEPVLRHVMEVYASQGFRHFVLSAAQAEPLHDLVRDLPASWDAEVVETGPVTGTGARLALCRRLLGETFFATYGSCLADIDLRAELDFHRSHAGAATVATMPLPPLRATLESRPDGRVEQVIETPAQVAHSIGADFYVMDARVFQLDWSDDLEGRILPALSARGQLFAYRHDGFWRSVDTERDAAELTALCEGRTGSNDPQVPWSAAAPAVAR